MNTLKNTLSKRFSLIFTALFFLTVPLSIKADIGSFDVFEFSDGNSIIYISTYTRGRLINHDLCYYDWYGEFKINIETLLHSDFEDHDSIEIYTNIEKINLSSFDKDYEEFAPILYILKGKLKISHKSFFENYDIIDAYNGNTYGFTYTPSLSTSDNSWLQDYDIDKYFRFNDNELCDMTLYGIKNNLSEIEVLRIKVDLDTLLKEQKHQDFHEMLDKLKLQNMIMIGFCSC